jgi:hypothetical protein
MILSLNSQSSFTTSFWLANPLLLKQSASGVWFGINIVFTQKLPSSKSQHIAQQDLQIGIAHKISQNKILNI